MDRDRCAIIGEIRAKIFELADLDGQETPELEQDELIPAAGLLDSSALTALMVWYESHFQVPIKQEEITIDNFGSLGLMADFVMARRS